MEEAMSLIVRLRRTVVILGLAVALPAVAAPIGPVSTQDCYANALRQRTLDHAACSSLPLQLRDACIVKAETAYTAAIAACASAGTPKSVDLRQNIDAPFLRRMGH
jgi:hypothetical protein